MCFIEDIKACWTRYISDITRLSTLEVHFNHCGQLFKGYMKHLHSLSPHPHSRYMQNSPNPYFRTATPPQMHRGQGLVRMVGSSQRARDGISAFGSDDWHCGSLSGLHVLCQPSGSVFTN